MTIAADTAVATGKARRSGHILSASMIGTTIEFFDFYIYATAAVVVFPHLFFPGSDSTTALLQSFATFAIAFFARPFGAAFFGHFGDRIGRKATLVAALLTMGCSTVLIGALPTYETAGVIAPFLLALCRLGQGLGLGGEWGGAVLLATENAPQGKRSWFGMFPQLGAPVGFILASGIFLLLGAAMTDEQFFSWGWRLPFLASSVLVIFGLVVRLQITETPEFARAVEKAERVAIPVVDVIKHCKMRLVLGTLAALVTFVLFYLMTVFCLSWGTRQLGFSREEFLLLELLGVLFFAAFIPISAKLCDAFGVKRMMLLITAAIAVFSFFLDPLFNGGTFGVVILLIVGFALMGLTYGPLGTALSLPFATNVRYTGSSLTFNLAGIFGASLAPYIATYLANTYGFTYVGYYLAIAAVITFIGFAFLPMSGED